MRVAKAATCASAQLPKGVGYPCASGRGSLAYLRYCTFLYFCIFLCCIYPPVPFSRSFAAVALLEYTLAKKRLKHIGERGQAEIRLHAISGKVRLHYDNADESEMTI